MIVGVFHQGSGLGNQLHRYVAARVLARDKGFDFGMCNPQLFKGDSFMNLDFGKPILTNESYFKVWEEKKTVENGVDIRGYDPEINFVEDNTLIDGEFQDSRYWGHRINEIREWLHVEPMSVADNVCVIGFRGGEYTLYPDLFLKKEYWEKAIAIMKEVNPDMTFHVVTDDVMTAKQFFPDFCVTHEIGMDWRKIRYARYAIISNSSFYIFPRILNEKEGLTIAPRFWARHNTKTWALPQNYYSCFRYI